MRLAPLCLLFACVVDNSLKSSNDGNGTVPFDSGDVVDTGSTTDPVLPEDCNGVDDDGDGQVDEGFADDNGNGRADCLDVECPPLSVGDAGTVGILAECEGTTSSTTTVDDPWNVQTKWTFSAPSSDRTATNSYAQPVIGNLTDDDGDGDVDEDDSPEVVISVFGTTAYIVAIDGATGTELWSYPGTLSTAAVLIADIDADGSPDVVGYSSNARPIALEGDGTHSLKVVARIHQ